jgi:hypothetical protein
MSYWGRGTNGPIHPLRVRTQTGQQVGQRYCVVTKGCAWDSQMQLCSVEGGALEVSESNVREVSDCYRNRDANKCYDDVDCKWEDDQCVDAM